MLFGSSPPSPSRPSREPVFQILTSPVRANLFTTGLKKGGE